MGSDYICKCPSGIKGRHCEIGELRQKALINFMLKSNYVTRSNIAPPKLRNNRYIFAKFHTHQECWEKKKRAWWHRRGGGGGGGSWITFTKSILIKRNQKIKIPPFVFFSYSRASHMISQISQSRQRTLTLTLENWRGHFRLLLFVPRSFS